MSKAGGCGILTATEYKKEEEFRKALQFVKGKTSNPFGINFTASSNITSEHHYFKYLDIAKQNRKW